MHSIQTQDHWLNTGHGKIYARRWTPASNIPPHAAPIVLLHDSLGCVALWRDFPEQLAQATNRTVIAYDRLGFGQSAPHPGKLDRHFISDESQSTFRSLRRQLGIEAFVAFGHSVGGGMAVGCAAVYSEACEALITESAQAFVEERTINGILTARETFRQTGQVERLTKYHGDKAAWVLSAWIDTWLAPDFADWTLDDDLRRVRCPVLVIHGYQDEYGTVRHPERIASLTAGHSTMKLLEECGHVPHRERTTDVLDSVARHLR